MGRFGFEKILDFFSLPISYSISCLCKTPLEEEEEEEEEAAIEREALIVSKGSELMKVRDLLEPKSKTVILRVSMHCNGCARKVEKHIKKITGVTSFKVDLEHKKVVVVVVAVGDITPFEILECVSKVKFAELWMGPYQSSKPSSPVTPVVN